MNKAKPTNKDVWMRKMLYQAQSYPHVQKIHRNLYFILAMATSLLEIEQTLKTKRQLPKESGFIDIYPYPDVAIKNYTLLLQEILVETAVFIRGHDDFWKHKEGTGWSTISKKTCGNLEFLKSDRESKPLHLREACNKIIHHNEFDYGYEGGPEHFTVFLFGKERDQQWLATIDLKEFCFIGLSYIG